jgi:hypothetical protein
MGRLPLVIDTDMRLPLESSLDYPSFILRVPHTEIPGLADHVAKFWDSLTDESYRRMQEAALAAYKGFLRYDAYFNEALPKLKEGGIKAVL